MTVGVAVPALDGVRRLGARPVTRGERWIYSAAFNVRPDGRAWGRVVEEVADLRSLAGAGARVAVLAHQGDGPGSATHLDHVARFLARTMRREVRYVPENTGPAALAAAAAMAPGDIVIFGNTRFHPGEQRNDPVLAAGFARLGERVAVGGFAKAHRRHASNAGILAHRPGFATRSLVAAITELRPWAGADPDRLSVAVLGGVKPEKITAGLASLVRHYDVVIPGGAVLTTVLAALGVPVGASVLPAGPERCLDVARRVLRDGGRARLHLPEFVGVARAPGPAERVVRVGDPIGPDEMIVDFHLRPWTASVLAGMARRPSRGLIAGTPACYRQGNRATVDTVLAAFAAPSTRSLLLGGDTVAELPWAGASSTGGGSALTALATGTCAVLEELRRPAPGQDAPDSPA